MRWRANRKLFTVRRARVPVASAHRALSDAVVAGMTSNGFTLADPTPFPAVSLTVTPRLALNRFPLTSGRKLNRLTSNGQLQPHETVPVQPLTSHACG